MADDGIRALAPIVATTGTAYATLFTVPAGKEWTVRLLRAVNITNGTVSVSVSLGTGGNQELAFNEFLPVPSASVSGAKNILGPDFITLPPGSVLQVRSGGPASARVIASVTERDLV